MRLRTTQRVISLSGLTSMHLNAFALFGPYLFAGTDSGGVFRSADNGVTWVNASSGMIGANVNAFAASGSNLFAGTDQSGVFISVDSGATWTQVNTGLKYFSIFSLAISGEDLFAGTMGGGIWRRPLSEMVGAITPLTHKIPQNLSALKIAIPSRSDSKKVVEFLLDRSEAVTIKIFNLAGMEVATLLDKNLVAGEHRLLWDTRNVGAGCCMIRMQAGPDSYAKSILISR
jgi:hypothetical protein